ncbi:HAD family hydrolase [Streptococcus chenjunshii]|uniref:HAD family hydrolase n=1 Tax=Streptococcus chenjunshii TaxID=2173853 RepID=A0A372KPR1_9STRE|nr:HAD-IA family hydrolase [Streptococcus chenjunshii]AXQ78981.1 HAD family hydrolase [Streptococcus chenjunshii]RFU51408.1 HAD family hydrolase [Streptococcus chenjunshii]RFU53608.1 HAD family hydrolase [Streptococcus chenjunshii]
MDYHDYIWDLGGTLLDNYELSARAFGETLAMFGKRADHDEIYEKLKESTQAALAYFIPEAEDFLKYYRLNEAKRLEKPLCFKGAKEVLQKIVAEGGRNFLISHRDQQVFEILEKTGLAPYFTEVITSAHGFARKPDPQSMLYLKDKYQIRKGLVIGDRDIDIQAGRKAGFSTLLFDGKKSLLEIVT